jgi:hypothetical protein
MPIITITGFECYRCGHIWVPVHLTGDIIKPKICPKCKSKLWDIPNEKAVLKIVTEMSLPVQIFAKSHLKAGDPPPKLLDCIRSLPVPAPANLKAWLEELWIKLQDGSFYIKNV